MDFWVHVYDLGSHPWLEDVSWAAQIALVVIAIIGAKLAYDQLSEIRSSAEKEVQIANATFLMNLDKRWDYDLATARKILAHTRDEINTAVTQDNPLASDGAKERLVKDAWTNKLKYMRDNEKDSYRDLMAIIGFFETVGLMIKMGYISEEPIFELFGGTIISVGTFFDDHIEQRANEMGVPNGLFKHARKLCNDARARAG
jgi:hypothetical protein